MSKFNNKRGFTLVELLITTAIFVVITTIVLVQNNAFNSSILLSNLAYEMALSIRQAQVFGVSVRGFDPGGSAEFDIGYGVHFDRSLPSSFIFFADRDKDKKYDSPGELVEVFSISRGNRIDKFCGVGASEKCSDTTSLSYLDIVFIRPNPEAQISSNLPDVFSTARIHVASGQGEERRVVIESSGQISIQTP